MKSMAVLRAVAVAHTAAVCLQPVLAGVYLNGSTGAMRLHEPTGFAVALLSLAQLLAATAWWRSGGTITAVAAAGAILVAEAVQLGMGYSRELALHVPLGIAIVAAAVAFTWWAVRAAARPRRTEVAV